MVPLANWLVLENVPGLLSSDDGAAFEAVVDELEKIGYLGIWFTCNTLSAGLPHNRERIFIVASYKSELSYQFYSDCGKLLGDDAPRAASRAQTRSNLRGEFITDAPLLVQRRGGFGYTKATSYCPTIRAQTGRHQGGHTDRPILCGQKLDLDRMRETNGISGRLDGKRGRLIGNAVAPPIAEFIGRRILEIAKSAEEVAAPVAKKQKQHERRPLDAADALIRRVLDDIGDERFSAMKLVLLERLIRSYDVKRELPEDTTLRDSIHAYRAARSTEATSKL